MPVKQLGYLIFEFTPEVFGRMTLLFRELFNAPVEETGDEALVRLDGRSFRLKFRKGSANRLTAIGWEVRDQATLDAIATKVSAAGYEVVADDSDILTDRAASAVVRFADADGFPFELFIDNSFASDPALGERFLCGDDGKGAFGLGHLVLICSDRARTQKFFQEVLGFGLSDRIKWEVADLFFLHCNQRHHSVALSAEAFGLKGGMIDHFMIETKSRDEVDRAYAKLESLGFKVSQTLGQHSNDNVYSFYMMAPAGFRVEFGYGGNIVEDPTSWQAAEYGSPSTWGHELVH